MTQQRLWLVRHAPPLVAGGTCYGALDVGANPAATRTAAAHLASAVPAGAVVFHSPLQRCEQLAQDLQALRPDLASTPDARLREMDFGTWEGRAWSAIARADIDAWAADFAAHRPGGGESLAQMLARVAQALHGHRQTDAQDLVWITHAGVARCVDWLLAQGEGAFPRSDQWPLQAPGWGEWQVRELA